MNPDGFIADSQKPTQFGVLPWVLVARSQHRLSGDSEATSADPAQVHDQVVAHSSWAKWLAQYLLMPFVFGSFVLSPMLLSASKVSVVRSGRAEIEENVLVVPDLYPPQIDSFLTAPPVSIQQFPIDALPELSDLVFSDASEESPSSNLPVQPGEAVAPLPSPPTNVTAR